MNTIKITSGIFRGRNIKSPKSSLTHPMGAREKLALFNMIVDDLPGSLVLDAFAGSGALGIEALSRGASEVVFVEKNASVSKIIRQNLETLGIQAEIFVGDVVNFAAEQLFDVILADPPYDNFDPKKIINLPKFLKKDGVLALSHPGEAPEIPGVKLEKTRKYAQAHISIYKRL